MDAQVILVNIQDEVVGSGEKLAVHEQGLLHRAFSVLLYRYEKGQLQFLLQRRNPNKYHSGGLWTNTCCSHPKPNEGTRAAAERRLLEETGVVVALQAIGSFRYIAHFANGLIEHELDHVFIAEYAKLPTQFDPEEISEMEWREAKALALDLDRRPYLYTPWFERVLALAVNKT